MAIQFARVEYVSRSSGGNACHKAAYNERSVIRCERTGELFNFKNKGDLSYHEILLPEGASSIFKDSKTLWNAAEKAEKRKDSQVAKESVIALPDNKEITHEDRIEITKRYANALFVSKGLAAQIDIHAPHDGEKNWHAHVLATTRRFTKDGLAFSSHKARESDPTIKKGYVQKEVPPGELYAQIQNDYFKEKGLDLRVDPTGIVAQNHIGPVRMRKHMGDALERANLLREANEASVRNPWEILQKLTQKQSIFTEQDLNRFLVKHVDKEDIHSVKQQVLTSKSIIPLYDKETKEITAYWTTQDVRQEEEKGVRFARAVNEKGDKIVKASSIIQVTQNRSLSSEQQQAVEFATYHSKGISIIEGRAGTGKSYTMQAIREIYEANNIRVIGLAPTNQVSIDMAKDGFQEAMTVHSFLFKQKNNRLPLKSDTIVIVDEAAMLGNTALVELLNVAKDHKIKVVMFGDDRQLSSVERGGMFRQLVEQFSSRELTDVRRQTGWQKQVSELLSEGHTKKAAELLQEKGSIQWQHTKEASLAQLVKDWDEASQLNPTKNRLVLANKNVDVDTLNHAIREIRLSRGEVSATGYRCQTARGKEIFALNDRVCLTVTDKKLNLSNGAFGTIEAIDEKNCTIKLDGGKSVTFDPNQYHGLKLGYASTVYKSQGKTIPEIYVLHDASVNNKLNYVALTRHKESLKIYANHEETKNLSHFAHQISRSADKMSSLCFATQKELHPQQSLWQSLKKETKDFLTDTFHKNKEFYKLPKKYSAKSLTANSVEKVAMETLQGERTIPSLSNKEVSSQDQGDRSLPHKVPYKEPKFDASKNLHESLGMTNWSKDGLGQTLRPTSTLSLSSQQPLSQEKERIWTPVLPVPNHVTAPNIKDDPYLSYMTKDKEVTSLYAYKDQQGQILGYVARIEDKDGSKITPTLTYCQNEKGQQHWRWKEFGDNRPLYGLDRLQDNKPILIVEGEKTADAAQKLLPEYAVLSWHGGAGVVNKADWSPLIGRDVTIWPNHNVSGFIAAEKIENTLKKLHQDQEIKCAVKTVELPKGLPLKWDLADKLPDHLNIETVRTLIGGKDSNTYQREEKNVSSLLEKNNQDPSIKIIKDIINNNPQYDAAEDIVNRVHQTYRGLKEIISTGKPLTDKEDLHLLKQCVYATGEALNIREMNARTSSHPLTDRVQAEKSAWMQAIHIEKTDSLRIQMPYQRIESATAFRENWDKAATKAAFNISLPNPTMDSTFTSTLGQEAIRLVNLLPNHHAQIKDFIHHKASHIDSHHQLLVKEAVKLADIKGGKNDSKNEAILTASKTLVIKEIVKDPIKDSVPTRFSEKITLETQKEQQRLQFIEQRYLQQQLQNQRTL